MLLSEEVMSRYSGYSIDSYNKSTMSLSITRLTVITLYSKQWWRPNKNLKFTWSENTYMEDGEAWVRRKETPECVQAKLFVYSYFKD